MELDELGHIADQRTVVWFIPGLAAKSDIFKGIKLGVSRFDCRFLDWVEPESEESLSAYANRMFCGSDPSDSILVAVSMGAMLALEIAKQHRVRAVVLISAAGSPQTLPPKFRLLRSRRLIRGLPWHWIGNRRWWSMLYSFGIERKRIERYDRFIGLHSANYLRWCLNHFILGDWGYSGSTRVWHIHGTEDRVFPIGRIDKCTAVDGGTHAMVVEIPERVQAILEELLKNW